MSRYLIVIEPTATGFSAYVPDVDGCVATGRTREDVQQHMREALEFHFDALREIGQPIPPSTSGAAFVDVAAVSEGCA